jgi:hypothetical protein
MTWLITHIVCYFKTALFVTVNAVVASIGGLISWVLNLLPTMPQAPSVPGPLQDGMSLVGYYFDVGWLVAYITGFFLLMGVVFLVMIPLRWVKAAD